MLITRGKHKGKTAKLHQFANDWLSIDLDGGGAAIVSPTSVELSLEEYAEMTKHTGVGSFWAEYAYDAERKRLVKKPR